jgi:phage terminase small subunit
MSAGLTDKQRAFCLEYLVDLNATQAAIRAGYSAKTARQAGADNLSKHDIQAETKRLMDERAKRAEIDADTVLAELLKIARADIGQAFNADGSLRPVAEMPEDVRRAIASVEIREEGRGGDQEQAGQTKKVRFWDKPRALEMLGRHLRMFSDRMEITGKDGGPVEVAKPTRSHEEVAEFSRQLFAGFHAYRHDNGETTSLDDCMDGLSGVIAGFASGEEGHFGDPAYLGKTTAMIWHVRRKIMAEGQGDQFNPNRNKLQHVQELHRDTN